MKKIKVWLDLRCAVLLIKWLSFEEIFAQVQQVTKELRLKRIIIIKICFLISVIQSGL